MSPWGLNETDVGFALGAARMSPTDGGGGHRNCISKEVLYIEAV